jgi:hypothetical protein
MGFSFDLAKTSWNVMPANSGVYVSDRPVWRRETIKEWARNRPREGEVSSICLH